MLAQFLKIIFKKSHKMFKDYLIVGAGAFIGGALRFYISTITKNILKGFPIGTLLINIIGCFLIGLFYGIMKSKNCPDSIILLLTTGFCGGFTTFSTLSWEGFNMIQNGNYYMFLLYVIGSILLGIISVWIGISITK